MKYDPGLLRRFEAACHVQARGSLVEVTYDGQGHVAIVVDTSVVNKPRKVFKRLYRVADLFGIPAGVVPLSAMRYQGAAP